MGGTSGAATGGASGAGGSGMSGAGTTGGAGGSGGGATGNATFTVTSQLANQVMASAPTTVDIVT